MRGGSHGELLFRAIKVGNRSLKSETEKGARGALFPYVNSERVTGTQFAGKVGNKRLRGLAARKHDSGLAVIGL